MRYEVQIVKFKCSATSRSLQDIGFYTNTAITILVLFDSSDSFEIKISAFLVYKSAIK